MIQINPYSKQTRTKTITQLLIERNNQTNRQGIGAITRMTYGLRNTSHNLNVMDSVGVPLSYQDIKKLRIHLVSQE